ncbi:hypothetical protein V1477_012808 [Vespula maculifrons]|uniref:Uncharacterized protein n=1 Tax=Vespula maculifrons TaxID=7453 RepID=A0ABD2BU40_VESMC
MRREESQNVRTCEEDGAEKKRKKRISVRCNRTHARVKKMKLGRKDGHRRSVHPTKTRVQKSNSIFREDLEKILKYAAIRSEILAADKISILYKYCRPRKQSNGATSTPDEFKPPNAKIAAPCVSAFGNRLTHSSTIQHRKLRSPLEHDRLCFRDKRRNPKLNLPQSRYLREHSGNTHANMLNTTPTPMPADVSECSSILPEREKRNPSMPEIERFFKHPYKNLSPSMVLGR